jgi:hypothetical protein
MKKFFVVFAVGVTMSILSSCFLETEERQKEPSASPFSSYSLSVEPSPNPFVSSDIVQEDFFSFTHSEWGYSLLYPISWDFSTSKKGFPTFVESGQFDNIRPAVNVIAEQYTKMQFSYPKMRENIEKTLKKAYPDILFLASVDEDISSGKRAKLEYIATINDQKYHILQYFFLRGDARYIFSFADSNENFDKNISIAQKMADSFSFTKTEPLAPQAPLTSH